jgi:hypothetical protein
MTLAQRNSYTYQNHAPVSPTQAARDFRHWAQLTTGVDREHCLAEVQRLATNRKPQVHKPHKLRQTGKYLGVTNRHDCVNRPWCARIHSVYLGSFVTSIEAARAYDVACWDQYHDKARLNFPEDV